MEPLEFDSDDVGLVEATVSHLYSRMHIGAVGDDTRTHITRRVMTPEIGFDDLDYSFDIGYSGEAQSRLILCDVISRTIRRIGEGHDETFGPGDLFLISRPGLPYGGIAHAPHLRFTVLDPAVFTRVVQASGGGGADPIRVLDHRPVSREAALRLQSAIAYVRDCVMGAPEATRAPLVISAAGQFLAANVLQAFPNTAVADSGAETRRDAGPGTLRRAVAFIEANPDLDITLAEIASAACVTPRALQLAFRRHLDTTPMRYLRRVRLDHAHDDLVQAHPGDGSTVTTIGYRWGFSNPSSFARHYHAAYGTSPGHTLRS